MLLNVRYPVHFQGQPSTTDRYKTVAVGRVIAVDVPEIAPWEATVAASISDGFRDFQVMEYGGRLFRRVCARQEAADHNSLTLAFESFFDRNRPIRPLSDYGEPKARPVAVGMWNRIAHRMYVSGQGRETEKLAWPNQPYNSAVSHWSRDEFKFEKWSKKLLHYNEEQFRFSDAEAQREGERLLLIGDELWIETPPPCFEVSIDRPLTDTRRTSPPKFGISVAYLPDWLDSDLETQYFPLSRKQDALEYARAASRRLLTPQEELYDRTTGHSGLAEASDTFGFDDGRYALNRIAMILAGDVAVAVAKKPELEYHLTAAQREAAVQAKENVAGLGWNPDEWSADHLAWDAVEGYQKLKRPNGWGQFPPGKTRLVDLLSDRVAALMDDLPVNVAPTVPGFARR